MNLVNRLSSELVEHFGLLWMLGLAGILIVSIWMFRAGLVSGWQGSIEARAERTTAKSVLPLICFGVFLLAYLGFMFWNEDFAFEDPHSFTGYSAIGIPRPPAIWIDVGRYWPLGYLEYNLISQLSKTATAYLMFGAVQLLIALWMLYDVMPARSPSLRLGALAVLLMAPGFGADFAELTYADRNVCFAVCVIVFCVIRYDRRPSLGWMIPVVVAGYAALYYKEMTTALIGTFAFSRILLKHYRHGWRNALRSPLEIGLVLAGACFAVQLLLVILPTGTSRYIHGGFIGRMTAASRYLTADPLLSVFVICFAVYVVQTLRRGRKFDPLWDPLAVGGVVHLCAVSVTGLAQDYLMGPTELVAVLTLVRLVPAWWAERPSVRPALGGVMAIVVLATITFGSYRLIHRKAIVVQTQVLANYLIDYYRTPGNEKSRLYSQANFGLVSNFASYLSFRGLPIHDRDEAPRADTIELAGSEPFPKDLCAFYDHFICRHDAMRVGDLVVRMPLEGENHWAPTGPPVPPPDGTRLLPMFAHKPTDAVSSLRPLLAFLYRVSPNINGYYRNQALPDDWASVSVSRVIASE